LLAQDDLFIPRNISSAYEKGTRSPDGRPGPEYWQNFADYKISVEVDPETYQFDGIEEIKYYNNSPDSLKRIVLRLYQNIFKKGSVRDYGISPDAVTDGVIINEIKIDGLPINLENRSIFRVSSTVAILNLPKTIPPNGSVNLDVEWSFQFSTNAQLRVGVYDSTSVFVGYWFPQVSVYDDIDGWDYLNYGGQVEFYNDFSNFNVSIILPNNFGVWATGELQNPEDVFDNLVLKKYYAAKESNEVIKIITEDDLISGLIYNDVKEKNTWIFNANNVSDFTFAFSDHYLWDGIKVVVDSLTGKNVFAQAIYPAGSPDFTEVAEISKNLIHYFTSSMPGIEFPFPSVVVFNNGSLSGGGMEFPMMINNGSQEVIDNTVALTAHELAHQYFPFYVGTNEKKYAFMDEGWAVQLIFDYMEEFSGINARLISTVGSYESIAGTEDDIAPMIISSSLSYGSYRNAAYNRPSIAYEFLNDMLGEELFIKALQEFIIRWEGKHPTPYDMFFTFNDVTGQDLTWFWKPWFFDFGYPDLAIDKVQLENNKAKILIRKIGNVPTPINLKMIYQDGNEDEYYYSTGIWKSNNVFFEIEIELTGTLNEIQLGSLTIPDSNRENNLYLIH